MALIVDKHRPRTLEALTYHSDLSDRLRALVSVFHAQNEKQLTTKPGSKR